jgi:hypothetical protein
MSDYLDRGEQCKAGPSQLLNRFESQRMADNELPASEQDLLTPCEQRPAPALQPRPIAGLFR